MGLDILFDATEKKLFYDNIDYFNEEDVEGIPFNERCQMRLVADLKNEDDFLDELSVVVAKSYREIENCIYTIIEKEELEELSQNPRLSIDAKEAINDVLASVDFDKEIVTVYPWW